MSLRTIASRAIVLGGLTTLTLMAFSAEVSLAADYQDAEHNVCEGTFSFPACFDWANHVTGINNVALGDAMMPALAGGSDNVALDFGALAANTEGSANIAIGRDALHSNTTGIGNVASGDSALDANTTGFGNVADGQFAMFSNTTGVLNVADGLEALGFNTTGRENVATGYQALLNNTEGSENAALGFRAGWNETGSNNVDVANGGVAGESGTTRIGTEGTQKKTFVAGIHPEHLTGCTVQVTTTGQLGCNETAGAIGGAAAVFGSSNDVPTGHCIGNSESFAEQAKCPTTGGADFKFTEGPVPAGGGSISNLQAEGGTAIGAEKNATVNVIDEKPAGSQTVVTTCSVGGGTRTCSNTGTVAVAAGDYLMVRIDTTSAPTTWRVSFRY